MFDGPLTPELYTVLDDFRKGKESVVKFYPQKTNKGLGEALRIGSEVCQGDFIFRMDSDDYSDPTRFEKEARFIESNDDIDVVGTNISEFNVSLDEPNLRVRYCPEKHEDIVRMGKKRNPMNHVSVCIRKSALKKCGGYQTLIFLEDYYLWLRMIASGCKLANINESLVFVRVGNGFNSKRGSNERIKGWRVLQDYMLKNNMITPFEARINMLYITVFVKTPAWLKIILYNNFLRK